MRGISWISAQLCWHLKKDAIPWSFLRASMEVVNGQQTKWRAKFSPPLYPGRHSCSDGTRSSAFGCKSEETWGKPLIPRWGMCRRLHLRSLDAFLQWCLGIGQFLVYYFSVIRVCSSLRLVCISLSCTSPWHAHYSVTGVVHFHYKARCLRTAVSLIVHRQHTWFIQCQ